MSTMSTVSSASLTPWLNTLREKTKGHANRTIVILIAAWLAAVLVACASSPAQPTQAPPQATVVPAKTPALDGATLLETRCSGCHSTDRVKRAKETRDQWEQTVTRMIGKGTQLTEAEKKVLVDYLAETYKP